MPRISMLIADEDLSLIDQAAHPNRSAFVIRAARAEAQRVLRERLDEEVARCLAETAEEDLALAEEFGGTAADGL